MGDGIAQVYDFDSCMAGELQEFDSATLGLAFNLENSYVGVVLAPSRRNTKLNKPIPVSGRFDEHIINLSGASGSVMHTEMPDFRCLELLAPDIMSRNSIYDSTTFVISGADESADQIYALDSYMADELLVFADGT